MQKLREMTYLVRDVRVIAVKVREKVLEQVDSAARSITAEYVDPAFILLWYGTQYIYYHIAVTINRRQWWESHGEEVM